MVKRAAHIVLLFGSHSIDKIILAHVQIPCLLILAGILVEVGLNLVRQLRLLRTAHQRLLDGLCNSGHGLIANAIGSIEGKEKSKQVPRNANCPFLKGEERSKKKRRKETRGERESAVDSDWDLETIVERRGCFSLSREKKGAS